MKQLFFSFIDQAGQALESVNRTQFHITETQKQSLFE